MPSWATSASCATAGSAMDGQQARMGDVEALFRLRSCGNCDLAVEVERLLVNLVRHGVPTLPEQKAASPMRQFVMPARQNPPADSRPPTELRFSALPSGPAGAAHHVGNEAGAGSGGRALAGRCPCRGGKRRGALPWHGLRRSRRVFESFETFPSRAAHATHLTGRDGRMLARSPALLARLPGIVLMGCCSAGEADPNSSLPSLDAAAAQSSDRLLEGWDVHDGANLPALLALAR